MDARRTYAVSALAAVGVLLAAGTAEAQARTSSLSWVRLDGAESCIAGPELGRAVEARLGRAVFVATSTAEVAVEGRAERLAGNEPPGWRAVLRVTDTHGELIGERVVDSHAASCEELGRIAAVAIALMIDPVASAPTEPPPVEIAPPDAPPPAPVTVAPTPPVLPRAVSRRWRFELDGTLIGALGMVPSVGVGGHSALIVEPPGFVPLVVEGTLVPYAPRTLGDAHADFLRVSGGLQICPLALRGARVALRGCVGVDVGAIFVLDASVPLRDTEKVLVEGHAALSVHWRAVGPLIVRAGLHLLVPFRAVSFARSDATGTELYAPAPVAGMLDLGVGVEF